MPTLKWICCAIIAMIAMPAASMGQFGACCFPDTFCSDGLTGAECQQADRDAHSEGASTHRPAAVLCRWAVLSLNSGPRCGDVETSDARLRFRSMCSVGPIEGPSEVTESSGRGRDDSAGAPSCRSSLFRNGRIPPVVPKALSLS